uniref:Uncharacterized protein n=1 Tax=Capra hircus TaxID=9925 RepID=A0A452EER6_CAPHI
MSTHSSSLPFVYGDLASITLQIQGQKSDANFKEIRYEGMLHALVRMGREEGLKALYSGIAPAMLHQASYGTYQSLKRLFVERPEDETLLINVVCGVLWSLILNSTLQGRKTGNFINIYQQEGKRGLWKGVSLTTQRAAIVGVMELPVYDLTKKHLILSDLMGDTVKRVLLYINGFG